MGLGSGHREVTVEVNGCAISLLPEPVFEGLATAGTEASRVEPLKFKKLSLSSQTLAPLLSLRCTSNPKP